MVVLTMLCEYPKIWGGEYWGVVGLPETIPMVQENPPTGKPYPWEGWVE